jgi:sulfite reductase (NADPH) flavoprotein alpha-component
MAARHKGLRKAIDDRDIRAWIKGRRIIDLLEAYPAALSAQHLVNISAVE